MLSIFIPQEILEDIVIDNMASDMEPEDQDVWYKIFAKQKFIYVSSWDEKKYLTPEDPLFILDSSGVQIKYASQYIEGIPQNHQSVTEYWNGIFLLDISEEEAAEIQRDYGVICQSVKKMDASILMDEGLRFSPKKDEKGYSWNFMLNRINGEHIPSNHLFMIDRYLLAKDKDKNEEDDLDFIKSNIYDITNAMLPTHQLKCNYTISFIIGEQKDGKSFFPSELSKMVNEKLIPNLHRPYDIDVEIINLTHMSGLYTATHNRCILTNYTVTQLEHSLKAFEKGDEEIDEGDESTCLQTILPQRLFTASGLNDYCDSPHKTHHDVMSAIHDNLVWWANNYLTTKSIYTLNGKTISIKNRYGAKKNGENWSLYVKSP